MRNGRKALRIKFGLAIRDLRLRQDLTQEELAHRALLHRTYLTDIERGVRNPSIEVVERLASGLGITLTDLFRITENMAATSKMFPKNRRS